MSNPTKHERPAPGEHGHLTTADRDACQTCNPPKEVLTSNRRTVPTFEGRLYTPDGNYFGNWVRRAEVDALLDETERLRAALLKAKRSHYYCEDSWYSCPQAEDGCADDRRRGKPCDCGADTFNAEVDRVLSGDSPPAVETSAKRIGYAERYSGAEIHRGLTVDNHKHLRELQYVLAKDYAEVYRCYEAWVSEAQRRQETIAAMERSRSPEETPRDPAKIDCGNPVMVNAEWYGSCTLLSGHDGECKRSTKSSMGLGKVAAETTVAAEPVRRPEYLPNLPTTGE